MIFESTNELIQIKLSQAECVVVVNKLQMLFLLEVINFDRMLFM